MRNAEKVFWICALVAISIAIGAFSGKIAYILSLIVIAGFEIFFISEWIVKKIRARRNRNQIIIPFDVSALNGAMDKLAKAVKEMASKMGGGL